MDIKKDIARAVSKKLKDIKSKWDPDTQPNIYELSNFLRKSGYRLVDIIDHKNSPELIIEAIKPGHLYPEIVQDVKSGKFYTRIENHGLMIASGVEEIIKGYETALGVLHHLEDLDLSRLEIETDEY